MLDRWMRQRAAVNCRQGSSRCRDRIGAGLVREEQEPLSSTGSRKAWHGVGVLFYCADEIGLVSVRILGTSACVLAFWIKYLPTASFSGLWSILA